MLSCVILNVTMQLTLISQSWHARKMCYDSTIPLVHRNRHRVSSCIRCRIRSSTAWTERLVVSLSSEWRCMWKTFMCKLKVIHSSDDRDGYHHQQERSWYVACEMLHWLGIEALRKIIIHWSIIETTTLSCDFTSMEDTHVVNQNLQIVIDYYVVITNLSLGSIDNWSRL